MSQRVFPFLIPFIQWNYVKWHKKAPYVTYGAFCR
jgi:hypothetical protein